MNRQTNNLCRNFHQGIMRHIHLFQVSFGNPKEMVICENIRYSHLYSMQNTPSIKNVSVLDMEHSKMNNYNDNSI